jgi:hypothetical protein
VASPRRVTPGVVVAAAVVAALAIVAAALAGVGLPFVGGEPETAVPSVTVLAAGDIAECGSNGDEQTARIVRSYPDAVVLTLGDNAYQHGTAEEFERCYGPSWGTFKSRTHPAPGNHEYGTEHAAGYFGYFGDAAHGPDGYYSFDLGAWHVVSLNSECRRVGGCDADEPQAAWLANDLARSTARCTLAYWHRPPFTSGRYGDDVKNLERMRVLWLILQQAGAEIVLTGHEHGYERIAPLDATGQLDPTGGMRLFVVGTGGGNLRRYTNPPLPATLARNGTTHGVLELELAADSYRWTFLGVPGSTFHDAGSGTCH